MYPIILIVPTLTVSSCTTNVITEQYSVPPPLMSSKVGGRGSIFPRQDAQLSPRAFIICLSSNLWGVQSLGRAITSSQICISYRNDSPSQLLYSSMSLSYETFRMHHLGLCTQWYNHALLLLASISTTAGISTTTVIATCTVPRPSHPSILLLAVCDKRWG